LYFVICDFPWIRKVPVKVAPPVTDRAKLCKDDGRQTTDDSHRSSVIGHRSSVIGPRSSVISHRSSVISLLSTCNLQTITCNTHCTLHLMSHPEHIITAGKPVIGDQLIGRQKEIGLINHYLDTGQSVVLIAPRRYGKTSLLLEILRQRKNDLRFTIYDLK